MRQIQITIWNFVFIYLFMMTHVIEIVCIVNRESSFSWWWCFVLLYRLPYVPLGRGSLSEMPWYHRVFFCLGSIGGLVIAILRDGFVWINKHSAQFISLNVYLICSTLIHRQIRAQASFDASLKHHIVLVCTLSSPLGRTTNLFFVWASAVLNKTIEFMTFIVYCAHIAFYLFGKWDRFYLGHHGLHPVLSRPPWPSLRCISANMAFTPSYLGHGHGREIKCQNVGRTHTQTDRHTYRQTDRVKTIPRNPLRGRG